MDIHDEITIPGQEARYGETPAWLADSPVRPAVKARREVQNTPYNVRRFLSNLAFPPGWRYGA